MTLGESTKMRARLLLLRTENKSLVRKLLAGCQQGKTLSCTKAFHLFYTALVF
jgi:hypothetical protein